MTDAEDAAQRAGFLIARISKYGGQFQRENGLGGCHNSRSDIRVNELELREIEQTLDPQICQIVAPNAVALGLLVDASVLIGEGAQDVPEIPRICAGLDCEQHRLMEWIVDQASDDRRQLLPFAFDVID